MALLTPLPKAISEMSWTKSKFRTFNPSVTMRIGGKVVYRDIARYTHRCAECLGPLKYHDAGLACEGAGVEHRFFVHKRDVPAIQALRDAEISEMSESYEIVDGLLRPKGKLLCR
jgi:hypothetical protein